MNQERNNGGLANAKLSAQPLNLDFETGIVPVRKPVPVDPAIYAGLGNKDQAFKWLEKAYEERDVWLMNLKVDPVFARLRSDKRFPDLLARAGLRP